MAEVYFYDIEARISQNLAAANNRIYAAVAWFTNQTLFNDLMSALKRKVEVKVLILDDLLNRNEFGLDFGILATNGASIKMINDKTAIMHNKFCIIDNKVITGSYNWTYHANKNQENIVILDEQEITSKYCQQFDDLCSNAKEIALPYEHLKWTDIKEKDFMAIGRYIYTETIAKGDANTEIRKAKLIELHHAYRTGSQQRLISTASMPSQSKDITLMDVLLKNFQYYDLKLWQKLNTPQKDSTNFDYLATWIFFPRQNDEGNNLIKGKLDTYEPDDDYCVLNEDAKPPITIINQQYIETLKRYVGTNEWGHKTYKLIPKELLCIECAKMFLHKFSRPMYDYRDKQKENVYGIYVLGIVKEIDDNNITFYEGWNPYEKAKRIQEKFFRPF